MPIVTLTGLDGVPVRVLLQNLPPYVPRAEMSHAIQLVFIKCRGKASRLHSACGGCWTDTKTETETKVHDTSFWVGLSRAGIAANVQDSDGDKDGDRQRLACLLKGNKQLT